MSRPRITIIAAHSRNGAIGIGGKLPWNVPEDLKFFKEKTMGKPVVMGRKTWESIGRPLPKRLNIVVTKNRQYVAEGARVVRSLQEAIEECSQADEIMVIGGANLYKQALPLADWAWITQIEDDYEGDAFIEDPSAAEWKRTWFEEHPKTGTRVGFTFQKFERIRNR